MIFNGKILKPKIVASKAKAFLLEAIGNLQIAGNNLEAEQNWLGMKSVDKIQVCLSKPIIKLFGRSGSQKRSFQIGGNLKIGLRYSLMVHQKEIWGKLGQGV